MAHKKGQGSTNNGRDSNPKFLGVKLYGGQLAVAGNIILRQRGTKFHAGENVYLGRDHTVHAKVDGFVKFTKGYKGRTFVNIIPITDEVLDAAMEAPKAKPAKKEAPKVEAKVEAPKAAPMAAAAPVVEEAKEEAPKKKARVAKIETALGKIKPDDLKIVEGIGPKIEGLLQAGGFDTWAKLGDAPVEALQAILDEAGSRYRMHNPGTWAAQAKMAAEGKWEELKKWQDELDGGR